MISSRLVWEDLQQGRRSAAILVSMLQVFLPEVRFCNTTPPLNFKQHLRTTCIVKNLAYHGEDLILGQGGRDYRISNCLSFTQTSGESYRGGACKCKKAMSHTLSHLGNLPQPHPENLAKASGRTPACLTKKNFTLFHMLATPQPPPALDKFRKNYRGGELVFDRCHSSYFLAISPSPSHPESFAKSYRRAPACLKNAIPSYCSAFLQSPSSFQLCKSFARAAAGAPAWSKVEYS